MATRTTRSRPPGCDRPPEARPDRYVYREALALFLVAPQVLYAVNRNVDFVPHATSLELADIAVRRGHWSLR